MAANDTMPDVEDTLSRLIARIEKLEGTVRQLRVEAMHPSFYCPSRAEFEALQQRVVAIEQLPAHTPLPPHPHP